MEAEFNKLAKDGLNCVDNLVQWMKNSKVIEDTPDAEAKVRKLFEDAKDKEHVEYAKFKDVVAKTASEQGKSADQFSKMLTDGMATLQQALGAAATAFQAAMSSK